MDRNFYYSDKDADWVRVALRKESVDRNVFGFGAKLVHSLSLSARRAWIEIDVIRPAIDVFLASLSARRAWIEIFLPIELHHERGASLSARRAWIEMPG